MSTPRSAKLLPIASGASGIGQTLDTSEAVPVGPSGLVSVQCIVDNGTKDTAPTDAPSGALKMYACGGSGADAEFSPVTSADADLLAISPTGSNAFVSGWASFECVPGTAIKIVYVRASGGGSARIRVRVVVS